MKLLLQIIAQLAAFIIAIFLFMLVVVTIYGVFGYLFLSMIEILFNLLK
jgi:hypothetical protein